ncbi:hypothetical protein GIB67_016401 [Kingdonia uniflora]|uniref:Uncharacterized protein n=1 Tax=Kingdonia uniflora TaxID=39325 RepID=A0A7J7MGV8_9MAGN|nr:hypothetical protein GIB67_016401 [Kingdonia uniflora]
MEKSPVLGKRKRAGRFRGDIGTKSSFTPNSESEQKQQPNLVQICVHKVVVPIGYASSKDDYVHGTLSNPIFNGTEVKSYPLNLDPFQQVSVECLKRNDPVIVLAHTSTGKTVVVEYTIAMAFRDKRRIFYTFPLKAMSNQKYRELTHEFSDVELMMGDVTISPNHYVFPVDGLGLYLVVDENEQFKEDYFVKLQDTFAKQKKLGDGIKSQNANSSGRIAKNGTSFGGSDIYKIVKFAMGLNMPAKTIVFTSVRKWDGDTHRIIGSGEYIQALPDIGERVSKLKKEVVMLDASREVKKRDGALLAQYGSTYILDSLLHCSPGSSENGSRPRPCPPSSGEKGEMHVVLVQLPLISAPSKIRINVSSDLSPMEAKQSVLLAVQVLATRFPQGFPNLNLVKEYITFPSKSNDKGIQDPEFVKLVNQIEELEKKLFDHPLQKSSQDKQQIKCFQRKAVVNHEIQQSKLEMRESQVQ